VPISTASLPDGRPGVAVLWDHNQALQLFNALKNDTRSSPAACLTGSEGPSRPADGRSAPHSPRQGATRARATPGPRPGVPPPAARARPGQNSPGYAAIWQEDSLRHGLQVTLSQTSHNREMTQHWPTDGRPTGPTPGFLVVEDEPNILELAVRRALRYAGFEVGHGRPPGRKAVQAAQRPPGPDLIVLDVMLPDMDGF